MLPHRPPSSKENSQFTFVSENNSAEARSHAMREHWKQRRKRSSESTRQRSLRPLLPRLGTERHTELASAENTSEYHKAAHAEESNSNESIDAILNVASQALLGFDRALAPSLPDPFQTCPVYLTSQHHKLLHHWLCTHAAMMFDDLNTLHFNPMKDVWFPLDFSNASSFNCIMAHSAAHLAHLYAGTSPGRGTISSDALKFKARAVEILRLWQMDASMKLSDNSFAAVVRLLTFERYWGTEAEWTVHRNGLQAMIEAKGGIGQLRSNWRLELVVFLVTLMSKPSWFESRNKLTEISRSSMSSLFPDDPFSLDKIRSLWLISFVQDMRVFMSASTTGKLSSLLKLRDAVLLLRSSFLLSNLDISQELLNSTANYDRLVCLILISVAVHGFLSGIYDAQEESAGCILLNYLNSALIEAADHLHGDSVHDLRLLLQLCVTENYVDGQQQINYVLEMSEVMNALSSEARCGIEKCLINLLHRVFDHDSDFIVDDEWTPDSLLASMHGT
ncbi:uncharacterized protein V1518DRAFT_433884 [Limtongia smithiae]|uniref:uncharacterized protein n=1 Tax=Limtongia smithiae TaxID=1125753 RepID=UPI0034CFBEEF